MSLTLLLVFLHLAVTFTAVAMSYGSLLLLLVAIRSNKAENVRGITGTTLLVGTVVPMLFVLGGLFGLAAGWVSGTPLLAPWLVISYVAFAVLAAAGALLEGPNYQAISSSVAATGDGPLSVETRAFVSSVKFRGAVLLDVSLLGLLVFDMVVKPFS
jgi:hypothetical protein